MALIVPSITATPVTNAVMAILSRILSTSVFLKDIPSSSVGAVVLVYVLLCSSLRRRRVRHQAKKLNYPDRKSMSKMTNVEAQGIIQEMSEWEFPTFFLKSLQFALFKVDNPYLYT